MKKIFLTSASVAIAIVTFISGCSTVPETGRSQLSLVSADQEMQLGMTSFEQMKKEVPISKNAQANALVQRVGQRIAAVAQSSMPNAQWEFVVFESKEANAFCLPGGKVGVYTGLLPITKTEAGLATVIGHEVAHAVARHGAERMSEAMALQVGGQAVGAGASAYGVGEGAATLISSVYGVGANLGRALPHGRKQESEADHIGLLYMARAGYDPEEAIGFWQRFSAFNEQAGKSGTPWFLRTHPVDATRIQNLQALMPKAKAEYQGGGNPSGVIGRPAPRR